MGKFTGGRKLSNTKKKAPFKSRKELRKEKRKAKKERKNEHYLKKFHNIKNSISNKNLLIKPDQFSNKNSVGKEVKKSVVSEASLGKKNFSHIKPHSFVVQLQTHKDEINMQKKLAKDIKVQRKKQLLLENKNEDKVIRKLEKQLRLNKRKSKSLPQSFLDEGLDCILIIISIDYLIINSNLIHFIFHINNLFA